MFRSIRAKRERPPDHHLAHIDPIFALRVDLRHMVRLGDEGSSLLGQMQPSVVSQTRNQLACRNKYDEAEDHGNEGMTSPSLGARRQVSSEAASRVLSQIDLEALCLSRARGWGEVARERCRSLRRR